MHGEHSHAARIVSRFKSLLPEETVATITDEHFNELTLLIESALDAVKIEQANQVLHQLDVTMEELREKLRSD